MNTILYYFTGTGNSLAVARDIAELTDAELIGIPAVVQQESITVPDDASVGIIFPLYAGGVPAVVVRFFEKLNIRNAGYVFSVVTEGGKIGFPARQTTKLCEAAGHKLDASWWIQMPDNYLPLSAPPKVPEQKEMYSVAQNTVSILAGSVKDRETHLSTMGISGRFMSLAYHMFMKSLPTSDKKFVLSPDCNSCQICAAVCPVDNIKIIENIPTWQHRCEGCLACIHFCPKEAINVGKKTELYDRYHHPAVSVSDMKQQKGL